MGKCKNTECNNETKGKNIYCSLKCRNYYVNKHIRDYSKNGQGMTKKYKEAYEASPKKCKKCSKKIPWEKRESDYCSRNCSATCININRKGIKYVISEEGLINLRKSACKNFSNATYNTFINNKTKYDKEPKKCCNCSSIIDYNKRQNKHCSKECRNEFNRKGIDKFLNYKQDTKFKFNLADYPDEFDFSLIETYGWYAPSNSRKPNIKGVSRDHMLSVREGFNLGIEAKLLAHPANCKLMIHSENSRKHSNSSITKEDLIIKINNWDSKYKQ